MIFKVGCTHDSEKARSDVLVINRGRLVLDGLVTQALNAMKHAAYPHSLSDYRLREPEVEG